MSLHTNGSVSKDFPLFHSNLIPIYTSREKHSHKPFKNTFTITNEHPDFFKLDGMKIEGYKNPYLNEVIKIDRNENFKKIDFARRQINLINFLNSNRKYSQDPKISRYIINANINEINKKREQKIKDKIKIIKKRAFTQENNDIKQISIRDKILNKLDKYIPKIDYKMTSTIDYTKPVKTEYYSINESNNIKNEQKKNNSNNMLRQYSLNLKTEKPGYLKNLNDYNISEAQQRNLYMGLHYQRKPAFRRDLVRGKNNIIEPPPYRGENWGAFFENYFTIENNRNQFRKRGGLFSEFIDKNSNVLAINKRELREKVEREMELRNILKNKKYQTINNSGNFKNPIH
jgi:hypothetical protein